MNKKICSFIIFFYLLSIQSLLAQKLVYQFRIFDQIDPAAWRITKSSIKEAEAAQADVILLHLNTYGGQVDMADSIRTALLETPIKTIVFVDHNAASAGALIAIACDRIYMHKTANIGAASVVNQTGQVMPEKYQSYMRSLMRSTAEVNGRNAAIAEGFVDPELVIDSIKPKGKVITFTSTEALKYGFCDGIVNSPKEVLETELSEPYRIMEKQISLLDKLIGFLINPVVSGILILLIIGGIYYELQAPGIGFALLVAVIAAILYFAPLYLEGLAANWEIFLFIVGIILLGIELFAIPGFGIIGILGIICIVCGLAFSLVLNDYFNFSLSGTKNIMNAFLVVLIAMIAAIILSILLGKNILNSPLFRRLVLQDEQRSKEGFTIAQAPEILKGKIGVTITDMRPSGKIEIEEIRYDALSEDGFISKGEKIVVTRHETTSIFVKKSK